MAKDTLEAMMISADLGSQLEGFVTKLVETGRYNSKSEVLREGIAQTAIDAPDGSQLHCTVSIGMADLQPGQALRDLLREADERLYRAKQQGRNRLVSN